MLAQLFSSVLGIGPDPIFEVELVCLVPLSWGLVPDSGPPMTRKSHSSGPTGFAFLWFSPSRWLEDG